jgi:hypothetical protein
MGATDADAPRADRAPVLLVVGGLSIVALAMTPYAIGMTSQSDPIDAGRLLITGLLCWLGWDILFHTRPRSPVAWALAAWLAGAAITNARETLDHMRAPSWAYVGETLVGLLTTLLVLVAIPGLGAPSALAALAVVALVVALPLPWPDGVLLVGVLGLIGLALPRLREVRPRWLVGLWGGLASLALLQAMLPFLPVLYTATSALTSVLAILVPIAVVGGLLKGPLWGVRLRWTELAMYVPLVVVFVILFFGLALVLPAPDHRDGLNRTWSQDLARRGFVIAGLVGAMMPAIRRGLLRTLATAS